ncbi:hypothetical protein ACJX0J_031018, partial [Zea mays]
GFRVEEEDGWLERTRGTTLTRTLNSYATIHLGLSHLAFNMYCFLSHYYFFVPLSYLGLPLGASQPKRPKLKGGLGGVAQRVLDLRDLLRYHFL